MHIQSRQQLIDWLARNAPDKQIRNLINHGLVTHLGLFYGGFIVSVNPINSTDNIIVGIRIKEPLGTFHAGRLCCVPWADYIGGETPLTAGDNPKFYLEQRRQSLKDPRNQKQNNSDRQGTGESD